MEKVFKNLKMTPKLVLAFVLIVLVSSISGITGMVMMKKSDNQYSKALVENGFSQGDIGELSTYLNKAAAVVRDIIMVEDAQKLQMSQQELSELAKKIDDAYNTAEKSCTTPEEQAYLQEIKRLIPLYRTERDKVIELGIANKNAEAFQLFHDKARPILNEITDNADALADLNTKIGNEVSETLTKNSNFSIVIILVMICIGIVISMGFATMFARSITKRINVVEEAAEEMAQGNIDIQVEKATGDEISAMQTSFAQAVAMLRGYIEDIDRVLGEMAKGNFDVTTGVTYKGSFKQMEKSIHKIIASMSSTIGGIQEAAGQVSSGADQVSSSAQALSQGSTEQASSVEELAATINEISHHIQETAEKAKDARDENEMTNSELQNCSAQMEEMVTAMDAISDKSKEISKIIKTIEDIAFQTNILALNAAVEAARAGEAGKGFAVVADEVRNLAAKSAEAANNTTTLIEETVQAVESGAKLSSETEISLNKVVASEEKSIEAIAYISKMAEEQAQSVAQVTIGIDQISSVVQTNSATAEESAAASEELSGQASVLLDLVRHFRFKSQEQMLMNRASSSSMSMPKMQPVSQDREIIGEIPQDYIPTYSSSIGDKY